MRIRIFTIILAFCLVFVLAGLAYIQIGMHERYKVMSEQNRLKIIPLTASRGGMFDRNGNVVVKDVLCFNVSVIYSRIRDMDSLVKALSLVLGIPEEEVAANVKKARKRPYSPVCVAGDIGIEKAVQLEEIAMDYPGLLLDVSAKREYVHKRSASHVLGYLGLINRSEFERLKHYGYKISDHVGRTGIEKYYDNYLKGTHGGKQVEVDHRGREVKTLGFREPAPGKDIYLTLDLELQKFCDKLLEGKRGAILVMDPENGAILAMSSAPTYDPEIFVDRKRTKEVRQILKDRDYPLLNRSIAGAYPPGSVFKVVVATGALEKKVVGTNTVFDCDGTFKLGRATFHCWRKKGHGGQIIKEAIKNSCNVYFFKLGLLLGVDGIAEFGEKFGFGMRAGIDLPGEVAGVLPTRNWKKKRFNEKWYKGDTVNYSIGQGYLLCTPLQIARMMSAVANGGYLVRPYIVDKVGAITMNSGEKVDLDISRETLESVREGLKKVVNDPRGTGRKAKLNNVVVAGKTGTAQTSKPKSHGWFAGFGPFDDPKLTVVVFDEYGGRGGYYAAETAGKIFRKASELGLM